MRSRWIAFALAGAVLLVLGAALGRRSGAEDAAPTRVVTVTAPAEASGRRTAAPVEQEGSGIRLTQQRTRLGAVSAATTYVGALDGSVILDPASVRRTVAAMASARGRDGLVRAYGQAAAQLREQLGVGTAPEPVVLVRSAPVGYRVDEFTPRSATISVWRVGIVGSGATVEPQQSWRTETASLVWEKGAWKVASLRSEPGPTPPLGASALPSSAGELFASVPAFQEFTRAFP